MSLELSIKTKLLSIAGVTDLVGDRIYAGQAPQNPEFPFLIYKLEKEFTTTAQGLISAVNARITVTCVDRGCNDEMPYESVKALAEALKGDGSNGLAGWSDQAGTPSIGPALLLREADLFDDPVVAQKEPVCGVEQVYSMWSDS